MDRISAAAREVNNEAYAAYLCEDIRKKSEERRSKPKLKLIANRDKPTTDTGNYRGSPAMRR